MCSTHFPPKANYLVSSKVRSLQSSTTQAAALGKITSSDENSIAVDKPEPKISGFCRA